MEPEIVKISPNYERTKLSNNPTTEDYIDVFEDRLYGWHLDWAEYLNKQEHAGFSVLQLAFSYFEAIRIYQTGIDSVGHSKKYFKQSFLGVFPELSKQYATQIIKDAVELIYKDARCGYYHSGMAKKRIMLDDGDKAIRFDIKNGDVTVIRIDRYKFVESIKNHATKYISEIRNPTETAKRDLFLKGWKVFHK